MRLQPLPENVGTARRVSEVVRQRVPGHRTGDGERPTAECAALVPGEEVKARYVAVARIWCLSVNSPELFFGLFRVRVRVRIRVNSVTETNMMTEKIIRVNYRTSTVDLS